MEDKTGKCSICPHKDDCKMYAYDPNKGLIVPVEMLEQEGDDAECDANGLTDCADLS